jgi:hypothetical protein
VNTRIANRSSIVGNNDVRPVKKVQSAIPAVKTSSHSRIVMQFGAQAGKLEGVELDFTDEKQMSCPPTKDFNQIVTYHLEKDKTSYYHNKEH